MCRTVPYALSASRAEQAAQTCLCDLRVTRRVGVPASRLAKWHNEDGACLLPVIDHACCSTCGAMGLADAGEKATSDRRAMAQPAGGVDSSPACAPWGCSVTVGAGRSKSVVSAPLPGRLASACHTARCSVHQIRCLHHPPWAGVRTPAQARRPGRQSQRQTLTPVARSQATTGNTGKHTMAAVAAIATHARSMLPAAARRLPSAWQRLGGSPRFYNSGRPSMPIDPAMSAELARALQYAHPPRIIALGDDNDHLLRVKCVDVLPAEIRKGPFRCRLAEVHRALADFKVKHGFGRAIAAPQVGAQRTCRAL